MANLPRIGVVTVTYNSEAVLPEFLRCAAAVDWPEVCWIVVDSGSQDGSVELLRAARAPRLQILVNGENVGVAAGNNQGVDLALRQGCEFVLLLNNDVGFPPDLLRQLVRGAEERNASLVVPKIYYHDRPDTLWAAGGGFQRWQANGAGHYGKDRRDSGQFNRVRQVTYAPTCCMLIHRRVFEVVGRMDENYFVYYDDVDFCLRVRQAGLSILYWPDALLWHKVSSLTGDASPFTIRIATRNKVYFIRKHEPRALVRFWLLVYQLQFLARRCTGLDSAAVYNLKRAAFRAGMAMPMPAALPLRRPFES